MEINDKLVTLKKDFSLWCSKRIRETSVPNELKKLAYSLLKEEDIDVLKVVSDQKIVWIPGIKI